MLSWVTFVIPGLQLNQKRVVARQKTDLSYKGSRETTSISFIQFFFSQSWSDNVPFLITILLIN